MAPKEKRKFKVPINAADTKDEKKTFISKEAASLKNQIESDKNDSHVLMSIKYLQHQHQCFSDWDANDMKSFWDFNKRLHEHTWADLYKSGGSLGNKSGLGFTIINHDKYPDSDFKKELSKDQRIFELRVNKKARVHGFRIKGVFYLCWLDKDHEICPMK